MSLRDRFIGLDDALAAKGVPPLTEWWRTRIGDWLDAYESDHVLELWAAVGRGAAKSTALYKLSLFFTLFGDFNIPPGERHFAIVLSRLKEEASKGIQIIHRWLDLISVAHHLAGDVIEIADMPRGIRVVAASVAASSGWRAYFVAKDERSKWPSSGVEDQDSEEIDTSASAMTATHEFAVQIAGGSAFGAMGKFFDVITAGSNPQRMVIGPAPTWIAAPHITEASTRRKEPDEKRWQREYKCIFQSGATSAIDPDLARACLRSMPSGTAITQTAIGMDSSAGRGDAQVSLCGRWVLPRVEETEIYRHTVHEGGWIHYPLNAFGQRIRLDPAPEPPQPIFHVFGIEALEGKFAETLTSDIALARTVRSARMHGVREIYGDQFSHFWLINAFQKKGLEYVTQNWTVDSKAEGLMRLRQWLRDGTLVIDPTPEGKKLVEELINLQETIRPSGSIGIGARRGGHDDRAAALLNLCMADANGELAGSHVRRHGEQKVSPYNRRFADTQKP